MLEYSALSFRLEDNIPITKRVRVDGANKRPYEPWKPYLPALEVIKFIWDLVNYDLRWNFSNTLTH